MTEPVFDPMLACMAAECIPLLLPLVAMAGVLTVCRMAYYRKCPWCGAALDPQEICDCQERREMQLPGQKKDRPECYEHPERRGETEKQRT